MRLNSKPKRLRDRADHQRLRRAGKPRDQTMATNKQRDQNLIEHIFLPDDYLANLAKDAVAHRMKAFDAFLQFN